MLLVCCVLCSRGWQGVYSGVPEPAAAAFEGDNFGVVDDPIDHRCGDELTIRDRHRCATRGPARLRTCVRSRCRHRDGRESRGHRGDHPPTPDDQRDAAGSRADRARRADSHRAEEKSLTARAWPITPGALGRCRRSRTRDGVFRTHRWPPAHQHPRSGGREFAYPPADHQPCRPVSRPPGDR